jgi:hypothetical protein
VSISTTIPADQAIQYVQGMTDIGWDASQAFVSALTSQACQVPTGVHLTSMRRVSDGIEVTRQTAPCITSVHVCTVTGRMTQKG